MEHTRYTSHFQHARLRAELEQVRVRLTGQFTNLIDFEDVRQRLHMELTARRTLREIPIAYKRLTTLPEPRAGAILYG